MLLNQFIITLIVLINMIFIQSLLLRFIDDEFDPEQSLTIGVDFKTKIVNIDDNHVKLGKMNHFNRIQFFCLIFVCYILALWDTAGQERFRTLTPSYYR